MAKFYGKDKHLSREELGYFALSVVVILLPLALVFVLIRNMAPAAIILALLATLALLLFVLEPLSKRFGFRGLQFYRGLAGENQIRGILSELPETFSVFADLRIGDRRGDIDFVVAGPAGLFLLEVKSHGGRVEYKGGSLTINDKDFPSRGFLRQVHGEIWALKQYLEKFGPVPYIHSVLVFSNDYAFVNFGFLPVDNVYIVQKDFLLGLFGRFGTYQYPLSREQLEAALLEAVNR
jgi:hypothetical protein